MSDHTQLQSQVKDFVRRGFEPRFGELESGFESRPAWLKLNKLGTELWLDTGSLEDSAPLWTREFRALTTNNTLLNREVQKGMYDQLVVEAHELLKGLGLGPSEIKLETAFILNAVHGLSLVSRYDAYVSVEEHTDLAHDVEAAVRYGLRYFEICPERFIIKIPLTAGGLLATRELAEAGVPINHTLGFSARQNYMIARLAGPAYVNVFLGRLGSFVADNGLGDGNLVGERATLASQRVIRDLREQRAAPTLQIGASLRSGEQVRNLAGLDVLTMPPKVASEFLELGLSAEDIDDRTASDYEPVLEPVADAVGLDALWSVDDKLIACLDALEAEKPGEMSPTDLLEFFADHECGDILVDWDEKQRAVSAGEGKIPDLNNWKDALSSGTIGLDALMNLAGLQSFTADQTAMDERVAHVVECS